MIRNSIKACFSLFRLRTAEALQYRAAGLANSCVGIFWGLIDITFYTIFYTYADSHGADIGLSLTQMISYIWIRQAMLPMMPMNIDWEILSKINDGDVGIELCRPLDLYFHWFSKTASGRVGTLWWRALVTIAVGLLIPSAYRLGGPASAGGFLLFLCSAVSAFLLCVSYGMLMVMVRLGITWGEGPTLMLMLIASILSGAYLPLQLWPDFLQGFLAIQPFAGYLDLPVRLYVGSMPPEQALSTIALQLGWTVVFITAGRLLARHRMKGIIVQGG